MGTDNPTSASLEINAQSIKLLLSTTLNEYSNEHERTATIDSKAGIALPILSTYFLAFAQMNNYKAIISMPVDSFGTSLLPIVLFTSYTAGLLLSMISVAFMAKVLFARNYCRINPVDLYTEENLMQPDNDFYDEVEPIQFS